MRDLKQAIKRPVAVMALGLIYNLSALLSWLVGLLPLRRGGRRKSVLLIGTFHNPNWMNAHLVPISQATNGNVLLVCDDAVVELDGVTYKCPPRWMSVVLTRALSKFLWALFVAIRHRPLLVMGYHIFPAGVSALVVARLTNAFAGYQVTAGQLELEGGGWDAENALLTMLGRPSPVVERAALRAVRQIDLTVVRGKKARRFLQERRYTRPIPIITGSVKAPEAITPFEERDNDLVFVGRLTEYKRPDRLLEMIAMAKDQGRRLNVQVIGDGPDRPALEQRAAELGIGDQIDWAGQRSDVPDLLQNAKVFVLTSRWEGVSIAMLEAMVAGCVPVVSNVGDLGDVIENGINGWIVDEDDIDGFLTGIMSVLQDADKWKELSERARAWALENCTTGAISRKWQHEIGRLSAHGPTQVPDRAKDNRPVADSKPEQTESTR